MRDARRFSLRNRQSVLGLAALLGLATAGMVGVAVASPHRTTANPAAAADAHPTTGPAWTSARMAAATPLTSAAPTITTPGAAPTTAATLGPTPAASLLADIAAAPSTTSAAAAPSTSSAAPAPQPTTAPAQAPAPNPPTTAPKISDPLTGESFDGTPTTGVLFFTDDGAASHYCTASVVHSPAGDLVVTAGHCVYSAADGYKSDIAFVPGYHDGDSPYGQWTPSKIIVSPGWSTSGDVDQDVGFLVMNKSAAGASIESVTGADSIAFDQGFGQTVTVPAYPEGDSSPVSCTDTTSEFSSTQTEWDCGGYPDGTSGGPFLTGVNATGEQGTVIGVIGGYEEGGDSPDVSYSCYFGSDISSLYQTAVAAG